MKRSLFAITLTSLLLFFIGSCDKSPITPNDEDPVDSLLSFKIGQMIMVGFRGTTLSDTNHIREDILELNIGGVVLYEKDIPSNSRPRNIESPEQLRALVSDLQALNATPLLVAIDQEGGVVNRLKTSYGFPPSVTAQYLGTTDDADTTRYWAGLCAATLEDMGINLNFAPVVDLNINPDCPAIGRWERSFSADPNIVIKHSSILIREHNSRGLATSLKHFPGHGSSTEDSHLGMADVTNTWTPIELDPYSALLDSNLCDAIMTAHIFNSNLDPNYPATLSQSIITGVLRDSLGYGGLIISDDMQMGAITQYYGFDAAIELALKAGVDILLFSNNSSEYDTAIASRAIERIKQLVRAEKITPERIDQSYSRIASLKARL